MAQSDFWAATLNFPLTAMAQPAPEPAQPHLALVELPVPRLE